MTKEIWFKYIVEHRNHWCHGFTLARLEKVKQSVFENKDIMWDLLSRHGADKETPEQMKDSDKQKFYHCIGNFSTSILYTMMENGIIKRHL